MSISLKFSRLELTSDRKLYEELETHNYNKSQNTAQTLTVVISHWWCCFPEGLTVVYVDSFWSHLITNRQVGIMWKNTKTHTLTHVHTNRHTTQTDIPHKQSNPSNPPPKQNTLVTPCDSVIAVSVMCLFIGNTIYGRWFNIETKICEVNSELLLLVSNYGRWSLRVN